MKQNLLRLLGRAVCEETAPAVPLRMLFNKISLPQIPPNFKFLQINPKQLTRSKKKWFALELYRR